MFGDKCADIWRVAEQYQAAGMLLGGVFSRGLGLIMTGECRFYYLPDLNRLIN